MEKQGIPPLLHTSTGPDNLQVSRGALLLTSFFPKPWRDSATEIIYVCKQRCYIMGSCSSCLEKKHHLNFQVHSNKNTFKIQGLIALTADKFLFKCVKQFGFALQGNKFNFYFCFTLKRSSLRQQAPKKGSPPHT